MRLFEAIVEANHRAVAGDADAGLHPGDFVEELPVVALTCLDPRLNAFFPNALALPADQFIWLRNAGNIITSPLSSTLRSLALACAVHGGREIAVIGHSDCQFCKITALQLLDRFKELGVERSVLPENLNEFFGLFGNELQNVLNTCDVLRRCPWIGPKIPVHGLLLNLENGKLDWLVNGYQALETMAGRLQEPINPAGPMPDLLKSMAPFQLGEMKFPETKIGELASQTADGLAKEVQKTAPPVPEAASGAPSTTEPATTGAAGLAPPPPPKPPPVPPPPILRRHLGRRQ